jgi:hypothetical protein
VTARCGVGRLYSSTISPNAEYRSSGMDEQEELSPFAERVGRVLRVRYSEAEGLDYLLDGERLLEAQAVEEFVWAFRVTESLPGTGGAGIGRIDPGGPPRLVDTLKAKRFTKWGLAHDLATAEIHDLLIAYGYDLGMSAEADGEAELSAHMMDRSRAWETVVALCQAPDDVLAESFNMADDLLPYVHDMAVRNIERVAAQGSEFRVSKDFRRTGVSSSMSGCCCVPCNRTSDPSSGRSCPRNASTPSGLAGRHRCTPASADQASSPPERRAAPLKRPDQWHPRA